MAWEPNNEGEDPPQPFSLKSKDEIHTVKLYQFEASPPCAIVRALLAWAEVPYDVVQVNYPFKSEISWSKYQKIPILVVNDMQVNDSFIIAKCLSPCLFGREATQHELNLMKEITFGVMVAVEIELFSDDKDRSNFVDAFFSDDCCSQTFVKPLVLLMVSQAPDRIRKSKPEVKPLSEYGETFKKGLQGNYIGGSSVGPADLMLWALAEMCKHVRSTLMENWLLKNDLTGWYERVAAIMATKKSIWTQ
uniref:GST N-terminal domain-containing protein n=1 Tax=Guillardia theta TaxID=55529 RepID=A0A7S4JB86_GUITH|mmetsp:Transcript_14770/g.50360  ORF Transcript_14770/g.50360 Transcript_14770/m.50360 type:complete len:248 (+) Transcript_14770:16-759(+)